MVFPDCAGVILFWGANMMPTCLFLKWDLSLFPCLGSPLLHLSRLWPWKYQMYTQDKNVSLNSATFPSLQNLSVPDSKSTAYYWRSCPVPGVPWKFASCTASRWLAPGGQAWCPLERPSLGGQLWFLWSGTSVVGTHSRSQGDNRGRRVNVLSVIFSSVDRELFFEVIL